MVAIDNMVGLILALCMKHDIFARAVSETEDVLLQQFDILLHRDLLRRGSQSRGTRLQVLKSEPWFHAHP